MKWWTPSTIDNCFGSSSVGVARSVCSMHLIGHLHKIVFMKVMTVTLEVVGLQCLCCRGSSHYFDCMASTCPVTSRFGVPDCG